MISFLEIIVASEIGCIYGILALGIYLTFRTIDFPDLTCDGSFVTGAAVSAVLIKNGVNPFVAIFAASIAGGLSGFCTGLLNVKLKIDALLSGIIIAFMLYSVNLRILGKSPNVSLVGEPSIFSFGNALIISVILVGILLLALTFIMNSDFGLGLRSIGQNRKFAVANGINVNAMIFFGLILSNALIGMCGAVFTQYQGFCDISQGIGCLVIGLASVIIGEKLLDKIRMFDHIKCSVELQNLIRIFAIFAFSVIGSVCYRIFISLAINIDILGLKTQDMNFITGLLIIFAMGRRKKC
jgi:putative ABC transport system permease protein